MKPKLQKTYTPKPGDTERRWWILDAADMPLGRVATEAATLLRGKHKPTFAPHFDGGDFVVVVNASAVAVSGNKEEAKRYYRHSGFPGGIREMTLADMRRRHPERIIEYAVKGMLPKNRLGRKMMRRLKVHPGADHPHAPQRPEPRELPGVRKAES